MPFNVRQQTTGKVTYDLAGDPPPYGTTAFNNGSTTNAYTPYATMANFLQALEDVGITNAEMLLAEGFIKSQITDSVGNVYPANAFGDSANLGQSILTPVAAPTTPIVFNADGSGSAMAGKCTLTTSGVSPASAARFPSNTTLRNSRFSVLWIGEPIVQTNIRYIAQNTPLPPAGTGYGFGLGHRATNGYGQVWYDDTHYLDSGTNLCTLGWGWASFDTANGFKMRFNGQNLTLTPSSGAVNPTGQVLTSVDLSWFGRSDTTGASVAWNRFKMAMYINDSLGFSSMSDVVAAFDALGHEATGL